MYEMLYKSYLTQNNEICILIQKSHFLHLHYFDDVNNLIGAI